MAKETPSKPTMVTRSSSKKQNKKGDITYKKNESSDDDSDYYTTESDDEDDDDCEDDNMDPIEYQKLLGKLFPSKYMNKKIKAGERLKSALSKHVIEDDDNETTEIETEKKTTKKNKTKKNKRINEDEEVNNKEKKTNTNKKLIKNKETKNKHNLVVENSDEESDEDENDDNTKSNKNGKNINIIFTVGGQGGYDDDDGDDYDDDDDDELWDDTDEYSENEDESVSTDDSEESDLSSDEEYDDDDDDDNDEDDDDEYIEEKKKQSKKTKQTKKQNAAASSATTMDAIAVVTDKNTNEIVNEKKETEADKKEKNLATLNNLKELYEKSPTQLLKKCIQDCENEIKEYEKKQQKKLAKHKEKNARIFKKVLSDKNTMNDFKFFKGLEKEQQIKIIKEVREINKITRIEKPYRISLLESNIPSQFKATAMKKINSLRYMDPGSGEYYKIKNWVDTFMNIPFNKYSDLPVNINNGIEKCHDFMENAKQILDNVVYGLNDAKMQIMQMLGQLITNPKALGSAFAIKGPMGTGKTTLVKEGISKILNRPFAFIALGGATDSSFLEGHSYTYEGSIWGKIVQIILDSKCMNPVIYFDELDKVSDTPKGEEIIGILTHLTDTSQNNQFHDKYFSDIDFDLSKCLFIFSYNDESKVNPILKDRMYCIETKGYDKKQKTIISTNYLLPTIRKQVCFNVDDIIIPDDTIHYIIDSYCNKESGVRNLKRCLEIIYTKLNLYRLMKPGTNLFEEDMSIEVSFPFTVTVAIVSKLIKRELENPSYLGLYL